MARVPKVAEDQTPTHGQTIKFDEVTKRWVPADPRGVIFVGNIEDIPPGTPVDTLVVVR